MDENLIATVESFNAKHGDSAKGIDVTIHFNDDDGNIELAIGDQTQPYQLKLLKDVYGPDTGRTLSITDNAFLPLLSSIEEEIDRFDNQVDRLTDAAVALALQSLSMNPESSSTDPLARGIQAALRLTLSLNDYSRQEVRQAIRQVRKSVDRHNSGTRGYLQFIHGYFGGESRRR